MKKLITLTMLITAALNSNAQDMAIQWQKTIGGSQRDLLYDMSPTADGGYILGGTSKSNISGDKTEDSNGGDDIWVVKTNETGAIQWQKTIGGSDFDSLKNIFQTQDGGYFIIAESDSNISGDKTENSRGENDFWILKLDATGNILWQHTYGGTRDDYTVSGSPTADGGAILGCRSKSGIGGDRTVPLKGITDAWVLKLDSNGTIEWQKSYGGDIRDAGNKIIQTPDGGYILGAESNSNISGDKTENPYNNSNDFWVVKLDATGTVLWDKTIGGDEGDKITDIINTADGGYLAGGISTSPISGDKTETHYGSWDYWVVKLDGTGNVVWEKTLGGSGLDYLSSVYQLDDGSYFINGYSDSNTNYGNKTEPSKGGLDAWFINLDASSGTILAQKVIGGSQGDYSEVIVPNPDGSFVVGAGSDSNISGDKTENSRGWTDYWIFKMESVYLGVEKLTLNNSIPLYPNPTNGNFTLDLGKEYSDVSIKIYNTLGQVISSESYASAKIIEQQITASAGIYFLKVSTAKEGSKTLKIIKQ